MHRADNGRFISFFGDLHPSFFGNVVKAMGGAKRGYPVVSRMLAARDATPITGAELIAHCRRDLVATVHAVHRLTPNHRRGGRACARPGARVPAGTVLPAAELRNAGAARRRSRHRQHGAGMEGLAMTGAWTDPEQGLVSVIVLEMGGSSDLCALLKPGEPVVLMGPTGSPTEIHADATVALIGGGLGNAVLFSIGAATARGRLSGDLFRRLQADARPLQGRGDRARRRCHRVVLRRSARLRPDPAAGPQLRRQHRAGDGGIRRRPARRAAVPLPMPTT